VNWDWDRLEENRERFSKIKKPTTLDISRLKNKIPFFNNFKENGVKIILLILILLWIASGFYIVNPDQVGVVKRFGAYNRITGPGPHFHLPYPIETVLTPSVTQIKRVEIGFRSTYYGTGVNTYRAVPKESLMLTGDENIVDVQFIVQYKIKDAYSYLFNISNPFKTVKDAAEAAMRAVIGNNQINSVLTTEKFSIQNKTQLLLQKILDSYKSGIQVVAVKLQDVHPPKQVLDAFKDVASAREDKSRLINQAMAYRNEIIPKARGKASLIVNEAEAYKETKIRMAQGESSRFLKLLEEYNKAPSVTRKRLYLETMEDVLSKVRNKVIISKSIGERVLPLLDLKKQR
jgi:membrane protease subunit HflK